MSISGDLFELQYYIIENFFYWKSKEKTLLTLNIMLLGFFGALPLFIVPIRYLVVMGLWLVVSLSSPFCVAIGQAIIQILIEYGLVMERVLPVYMSHFHHKMENVYVPRVKSILSWIPIVNRYLPADRAPRALNLESMGRSNSYVPSRSSAGIYSARSHTVLDPSNVSDIPMDNYKPQFYNASGSHSPNLGMSEIGRSEDVNFDGFAQNLQGAIKEGLMMNYNSDEDFDD